MSRERFGISDFSLGIIKRMDAEDIPYNAASDSNNIDGDAPEGQLQAIPASLTVSTLATASRLFEWIKRLDGSWNLIHVDAANINVMADFYGAPSAAITPVACAATSMVSHNEEVHVAVGNDGGSAPSAPNWTGYCDYGQFGGATLGWKSLSAVLARPAMGADYNISTTGHTGTTTFDAAKIYKYNISFVYDGVQESPLGNGVQTFSIAAYGSDPDYVTVRIRLETVANLNVRVTGLKLYRKEYDSLGNETSLWKLQQQISTTAAVGYVDRSGSNISWVTDVAAKYIDYVDNNTDILSSYEEQSGMPETLTSSDVYYTLNTDLNAFHFVAGCAKAGLPDATMMMFRSKQYRYDMFDWSQDFLKLPTTPTALKAFGGKIYAFDENSIHRINPDGMYIEHSTTGIGCLSQRSIVITDYGMFWCDNKNAYWHDGSQIRSIGDAVRQDYTSSAFWSGFSSDYTTGHQGLTPIVVFHAPKNYILFIMPDYAPLNGVSNVWAYHVQKQRWDKWTSFTACPAITVGFGAFSGRNGEVYVSDGTNLVEPLGGTNKRIFDWTSQIITFGELARPKIFYKLISDNTSLTAAPVFTYGKDRATPTSSLTGGEFKVGGDYDSGKTLQIKITEATAYNNIVYSFEILFRKLFEL